MWWVALYLLVGTVLEAIDVIFFAARLARREQKILAHVDPDQKDLYLRHQTLFHLIARIVNVVSWPLAWVSRIQNRVLRRPRK